MMSWEKRCGRERRKETNVVGSEETTHGPFLSNDERIVEEAVEEIVDLLRHRLRGA